jgi:hypothetical protein
LENLASREEGFARDQIHDPFRGELLPLDQLHLVQSKGGVLGPGLIDVLGTVFQDDNLGTVHELAVHQHRPVL